MPDPVLLVGALVIVVGIAILVVLARDNHTFTMSESRMPEVEPPADDWHSLEYRAERRV